MYYLLKGLRRKSLSLIELKLKTSSETRTYDYKQNFENDYIYLSNQNI